MIYFLKTYLAPMRIEVNPMSVNEAFYGKKVKTEKYRNYEKEVLCKLKMGKLPPAPYEVHITFAFSNEASDLDNPVKPFVDILQKKYNFNDKLIWKFVLVKQLVPKGQEFIDFGIRTYKQQNPTK